MSLERLTKSAVLGLTVAAFTAPAASAQIDLRSPDARAGDTVAAASQDLRSPDARVLGEAPGAPVGATPASAPAPWSACSRWGWAARPRSATGAAAARRRPRSH